MSSEQIEVDDRGVARVAGTRSRVLNIVLDSRNGMTPQKIQQEYPHLSLAQIHAALAYYEAHRGEIDSAIEQELQEVASLRSAKPQPSRDELVARLHRTATPKRKPA